MLPDSVQTIGINAFYHNTALASASFGTGLTSIGENAFRNCSELQSVVFRECDTPLLSIGNCAFASAVKLTTLTFNESLKTIGMGAFAGCTSLEALTLPDSLTTLYGSPYSNEYGAFAECTALKSVKLGSGLVTIGHGANGMISDTPDGWASSGVFGNCGRLETVEFNQALVTIGHHAFSECIALKSIVLPDSVQTIGINAFYNNIRLTSISFGANLQEIGECAFMGCVSLSSVSFSPATTPLLTIKSKAFKGCVQLAKLTLSNAMPTLEIDAFNGCTMLRSIVIPSQLSTIQSGVLSGLANLRDVTFLGLPPENLENAGLRTDVLIRYSSKYHDDWAEVITAGGFTNVEEVDEDKWAKIIGEIIDDSGYNLSTEAKDRAIASIEVNADMSLANFVMKNGKVYDCIIRIVNTAAEDVSVTLPTGYTYETFKSATPLTIPANSRNILTITRTSDSTFLVTREELAVLQQ